MSIKDGVQELLAKDELAEYSDDEGNIVVRQKPVVHKTVTLLIKDKRLIEKHRNSVVLKRSYSFPKAIEPDVYADIIHTMHEFVMAHRDHDIVEAWNGAVSSVFGQKLPDLFIKDPDLLELGDGEFQNLRTGEVIKPRLNTK